MLCVHLWTFLDNYPGPCIQQSRSELKFSISSISEFGDDVSRAYFYAAPEDGGVHSHCYAAFTKDT